MSGKYNQIPIGAHRIKFKTEVILHIENEKLMGAFIKKCENKEKIFNIISNKIFYDGYEGTFNLEITNKKVYWNVYELNYTLKPMFTQFENALYVKIYKEE